MTTMIAKPRKIVIEMKNATGKIFKKLNHGKRDEKYTIKSKMMLPKICAGAFKNPKGLDVAEYMKKRSINPQKKRVKKISRANTRFAFHTEAMMIKLTNNVNAVP